MDTPRLQREREANLVLRENHRAAPPPPPPPPSFTSSPAHEFSFSISLHPPLKTPPSIAVDVAPADDIFLHGHLLPLHLVSNNTRVSPRSSDTSADGYSLPLDRVSSDISHKYSTRSEHMISRKTCSVESNDRPKHRSFSFIHSLGRWKKGSEREAAGRDTRRPEKKGLDLGHFLKKYASMVEHLLFSKAGDKERRDLRRRPHSFSGPSKLKETDEWRRRRRGQLSAPASMRTSPTSSGYLSAMSVSCSSSNESTMEELQNAIQAAIAHCKSSIVAKETCK